MRSPSFLIVTQTVTPAQWTAVPWGASRLHKVWTKNRKLGVLSAKIDGYKSGEKDHEKSHDREWEHEKSKKSESQHGMD